VTRDSHSRRTARLALTVVSDYGARRPNIAEVLLFQLATAQHRRVRVVVRKDVWKRSTVGRRRNCSSSPSGSVDRAQSR